MLRNEVDMWKAELQNEKIAAATQRENFTQGKSVVIALLSILEIEQLKATGNSSLERERKGWSTITSEKENVIETMRRQYDDALQELGRQKARWEDFESKKRELMTEFETQIINAARALEEERYMRKEHEKTLDILTKTSIDSNQKSIRLESELSRQQQNIQQLQHENKNTVETLNSER
jgi:chromosome segregation ATPase